MQTKREPVGYEMTLLPPVEQMIPEEYWLRKLNRVLDLSFVHDAVRDRYCQDNGRGSIDPEVVIRLFLLYALTGVRSIRELMREVQVNVAYRWFIKYRVDEPVPDHSTLSKALDRFGDAVFDELFARSITQCQASGLIEGRVLHLDATVIRADLDESRVDQPDSPDPDARLGRFPGDEIAPGYKQHTVVDNRARVVVGLSVTAADVHESTEAVGMIDQATARLGETPEVVCADAAYASGANRAALEERGVRLVSPPPKPVTYTGTDYFTTEDFTYDAEADVFECPGGATLQFIGCATDRPNRRRYRTSKRTCHGCALREKCTRGNYRTLKVGTHHAALVRLRADSRTESFRELYRTRAPAVEGVFAEAKCWHGLRRARWRGLVKVRVQCLLVAAVLNFKRLASLPQPVLATIFAMFVALHRLSRRIERQVSFRWRIPAFADRG